MKTVLIVEDEKMIRQGLRVMIQRSGVPVDVILECNNGEMALEVIKEHEVDVMFTDIRMPKMDGIQLVQEIQKLDRRPLIVAVSGYDDFTFAVEMLRNGVREYLLKPVERQKVTEILTKLNEEIEEQKLQEETDHILGQNQIKHLITGEVTESECELLEKHYGMEFYPEGYLVCVASKSFWIEDRTFLLYIDELADCNLCVLPYDQFDLLAKNELWQECAGVSRKHQGLSSLHGAYEEAYAARKRAFYRMERVVEAGEEPHVPQKLIEESRKLTAASAWTKRIQLIGTDKTEEIEKQWRSLFVAMEREYVTPEEFEQGVGTFFDGVQQIYQHVVSGEFAEKIARCRKIYQFVNLEEYREELMELIMELHRASSAHTEVGKNEQKIRQAVAYIEEHYNEELNMAVVSNYISMNYSLFSFEFKQYTGSNFVNYLKDLRIEHAKKLLAETDDKIIDISQKVGYENEKHFMKTFKSMCGVSPTEYRKNMEKSSLNCNRV